MSVGREWRLLTYFRELKRKPDLTTLVSRKIFQKITYFMQEFGVDLNYSFGFYIYGPYSPELANEGFEILSTPTIYQKETPKIEPTEKETLTRVKKFLEDVRRISGGKNEDYWLELLSSIHFLAHYSYPKARNPNEAWEVLETLKKKKFQEKDFRKAWDLLEEYGLVQ